MELKEYIQIIKKHSKFFIFTAVIIFLAAFAYFYFRPVSYTTSLTLNITRSGSQETSEYKYDDFYRLQADEKFAETIVQWIGSPRIEENILKNAGIDTSKFSLKKLGKSLKAEKMSSQVVQISFSASNFKTSRNIAQSVSRIVFENTQNLNKDQEDNTWFEIISEDPVIRIDKTGILEIFGILFSAIFLAFWVTLAKHYLE
jgi:capsular polysaccharide biosynthesis protein